jgi:hypothetical protein
MIDLQKFWLIGFPESPPVFCKFSCKFRELAETCRSRQGQVTSRTGQKQTSTWIPDAASQQPIMLVCIEFDHGQIPRFFHSLQSPRFDFRENENGEHKQDKQAVNYQ